MNPLSSITPSIISQTNSIGDISRAESQLQSLKDQAATLGNANKADQNKEMVRLRKVAEDFESVLLNQIFQRMRATVPKSDFFGDTKAEEIFGEMRDAEMSKTLAKAGGIGLADILVEQMKGLL